MPTWTLGAEQEQDELVEEEQQHQRRLTVRLLHFCRREHYCCCRPGDLHAGIFRKLEGGQICIISLLLLAPPVVPRPPPRTSPPFSGRTLRSAGASRRRTSRGRSWKENNRKRTQRSQKVLLWTGPGGWDEISLRGRRDDVA